MSLNTFYDRVRAEIRRGTSLDDVIPAKSFDAQRWLERNQTFEHMKRRGSGTLAAGTSHPVADLGWPAEGIRKSILLLEWITPGERRRCRRVYESLWPTMAVGVPSEYRLSTFSGIVYWNAEIAEPLSFETWWAEFSAWPTDPDEDSWWTANAEDVLLYQTVATIAKTVMRDAALGRDYDSLRAEAIRTMLLAQDEELAANSEFWMDDSRYPYE